MTKHLLSGLDKMMLVLGRDDVWVPTIPYAPMESCRTGWQTVKSEVESEIVSEEVELSFADVLDSDELYLLLEI